MNKPFESLRDLFKQLGLPNSCPEIESFIGSHAPLNESVLLADAAWWNPVQREFLKEEFAKDANWSGAIDLLNTLIRQEN